MKDYIIGVVIATSYKRSDLLFSRSLKSVINQIVPADIIIIVDDNNEEEEYFHIKERLEQLHDERCVLLRNSRTKGMSGTGAWNTGASYLTNEYASDSDVYMAILDDDDDWKDSYIQNVRSEIDSNDSAIPYDAVFANIKRLTQGGVITYCLSKNNLRIENFLIGNPGVQGSNMVFNLKAFNDIGGFDEELSSTTDRDIMIRFLEKYGNINIGIINAVLVNHYAGTVGTVTSNLIVKHKGLNLFYKKHNNRYTEDLLIKSLKRANKYFNYSSSINQILK